jgi:hypothetical protein
LFLFLIHFFLAQNLNHDFRFAIDLLTIGKKKWTRRSRSQQIQLFYQQKNKPKATSTNMPTLAAAVDPRSASVASSGASSATGATTATGATSATTITTLQEANDAFANVSQRAQRCALQVATFKAHEQQIRRFLLEHALPAGDASCRERDMASARHDDDYGNALLRLKGVNVGGAGGASSSPLLAGTSASPFSASPSRFSPRHQSNARAVDDPQLAQYVDTLRAYSQRFTGKAL